MVTLSSYLMIGALLFSAGLACVVIRRNAIQMIMGIELILNGAALNFVAFSQFAPMKSPELALSGQAVAVFVIVLAAAEAAVALALVLSVFRLFRTVQVDAVTDLKG